jgi:hypothetical protein
MHCLHIIVNVGGFYGWQLNAYFLFANSIYLLEGGWWSVAYSTTLASGPRFLYPAIFVGGWDPNIARCGYLLALNYRYAGREMVWSRVLYLAASLVASHWLSY